MELKYGVWHLKSIQKLGILPIIQKLGILPKFNNEYFNYFKSHYEMQNIYIFLHTLVIFT